MTEVNCRRCHGRGYLCRYPKPNVIRTYNCPRCRATSVEPGPWYYKQHVSTDGSTFFQVEYGRPRRGEVVEMPS